MHFNVVAVQLRKVPEENRKLKIDGPVLFSIVIEHRYGIAWTPACSDVAAAAAAAGGGALSRHAEQPQRQGCFCL
jgi:hypothetical protein